MKKYVTLFILIQLLFACNANETIADDAIEEQEGVDNKEDENDGEKEIDTDEDGGNDDTDENELPTSGILNYGDYIKLSNSKDSRVAEASGIAASMHVPGAYWVHNDSGHEERIFLCDPYTGETLNDGLIANANNTDWEDMASFRIDGKSYLIVAAIGDNATKRTQYQLYILEEPAVGAKGPFPYLNKIKYTYSDGKSKNAESVAVDTHENKIYIITKRGLASGSEVYSLPLSFTPTTAIQKASFEAKPEIKLATAMDISPDGKRAIVITNQNNDCKAYQFYRKENETWGTAFSRPAAVFNTPIRGTYEAICYALDGKTMYDKTEGGNFGKFEVLEETQE